MRLRRLPAAFRHAPTTRCASTQATDYYFEAYAPKAQSLLIPEQLSCAFNRPDSRIRAFAKGALIERLTFRRQRMALRAAGC